MVSEQLTKQFYGVIQQSAAGPPKVQTHESSPSLVVIKLPTTPYPPKDEDTDNYGDEDEQSEAISDEVE